MVTEETTGGKLALSWNSLPCCPPQERIVPRRKRRKNENERMGVFVFFVDIISGE
jgi:hypothetical protein